MADPEILKTGWGAEDYLEEEEEEDIVSASSPFIANAHTELYAFFCGKKAAY